MAGRRCQPENRNTGVLARHASPSKPIKEIKKEKPK
jgi:hypothetical protein